MEATIQEKASLREDGPGVLMLLSNAYDPDPRVREEALALIRMGCRVRILAWDRDCKAPATEIVEDVAVERVFLRSKHGRGSTQLLFYVALYLNMLWRGWKTPFDVVHCHDLDTLPLGFILGKLRRKPIVYDAHESFPDMLAGSVHPAILRGLFLLEDWLIRRIDLLITVGEKLRSHFEGRGARHSAVVGNWKRINLYDLPAEVRANRRARLGIPDNALTAVCITNLLPDRRLRELLDAVDALTDVHAVIGGKGSMEEVVRARAQQNGRIHYLGHVPNREIAAWTAASDVVYYGFDEKNPNARFSAPNKLFEALAAGRPLITGDFGEIADVVRSASCGFVVPHYSRETVADALKQLRDNVELRKSMAANARRTGRTSMSWDKAEQTLYQEYSALLSVPLERPHSVQAASEAAAH